jgi:hypothetical protein
MYLGFKSNYTRNFSKKCQFKLCLIIWDAHEQTRTFIHFCFLCNLFRIRFLRRTILTELKFQLGPYGHLMNPDKICFFFMQENLIGAVLFSLGQLGGDTDGGDFFLRPNMRVSIIILYVILS